VKAKVGDNTGPRFIVEGRYFGGKAADHGILQRPQRGDYIVEGHDHRLPGQAR